MKLKSILTLLIAFSTIIYISCERENEISNNQTENLLLQLDAKEIALEHNRILGQIHDIQSKNAKVSLSQVVCNLDVQLTEEQKQDLLEWVQEHDVEDMDKMVTESFNSDLGLEIYNNIDKAVSTNFSNPSILRAEIEDLISRANEEINDEHDLQLIKIFGETSMASSEYWYKDYKGKKALLRSKRPSDTVRADGKGAAGASISWAIVAAASSGPAAPFTYFLAVGVSAAMASIMA